MVNFHGVILLDKPLGMSSNHAVQRVRRLLGAKKAGHTGTLDPLATGMLPICVGEATKFSSFVLDAHKTYRVTMRLGEQRDTGDAEGAVIARSEKRVVTESALQHALQQLTGDILQIPPMYSALKREGKPLYALARAGIQVERVARPIRIMELVCEAVAPPDYVLRVQCSKGTYIRTLVEDLARSLGTVAFVTTLRRLQVAHYREQDMCALSDDAALLVPRYPVASLVEGLSRVMLSETEAVRWLQGQRLRLTSATLPPEGMVAVFATDFLGVGLLQAGVLHPKRA